MLRSRTRTPRLPARSMTKKRSAPLASTVGSPALSGTSSSELTGRPSCVTPAPARASKRTFWLLTTKLPAVSASEGLSSTSALPAPRPKVLSPGFSQNSPARVSQPSSPVSASRRWRTPGVDAGPLGLQRLRGRCAGGGRRVGECRRQQGAGKSRGAAGGCDERDSMAAPGRGRPRQFKPSAFAAEDFLAHVGDLARARRPRPLAAFRARTAVAARADDARRVAPAHPRSRRC